MLVYQVVFRGRQKMAYNCSATPLPRCFLSDDMPQRYRENRFVIGLLVRGYISRHEGYVWDERRHSLLPADDDATMTTEYMPPQLNSRGLHSWMKKKYRRRAPPFLAQRQAGIFLAAADEFTDMRHEKSRSSLFTH